MATTFGGRLAGKDLLTPIRSLTPHWGETVLSVGKTVGKASKPAYGKAAASSLAPVLGKAVGQAGAIFAAWEIGKMIGNGLSDYVINPTVQWMTGNKNANLGTAIYEWTHPDPSQAPQASRIAKQPDINPQTLLPNKRPSLLEANTVRASGQIEVNFTNAPAGLRVAQTSKTKSDVPLNVYVGYNSFATGMP
jgi:hypothetical protein